MRARLKVIPAIALIVISTGRVLTSETPAIATGAPPPAQTKQELSLEELIKKARCLRCHSVDKKVVGPSFQAIADRYKDDPRARQTLVLTVTNGGKGNWTKLAGGVPMPPHSSLLSTAEIERLVNWVLSQRNSDAK